MKNFTSSLFVVMLLFGMLSCNQEQNPEVKNVDVSEKTDKTKSLDPNARYAKTEFGIEGMTCAIGCAKTIERKLAKVEGVKSAKVDFDKGIAMVEYNEEVVEPKNLVEAVAMAGEAYKVKDLKSVEEFTGEHMCSEDCCKGKSEEEKANCKMDCCNSKI